MLADKNLVALDPEIKGFDPLLLEGVRLHPRPQRRRASQRRLTSRRGELNLGMGTLHRRIEVASIEGLKGAPQRVDCCRIATVHRPRSISLSRSPAASRASVYGPGASQVIENSGVNCWATPLAATVRLPPLV